MAIQLKSRQQLFVDRCLAALEKYGNTLGIAPTGCGKTIMLSAVAGKILENPNARVCILAHREEITAQNREKFAKVNPNIITSVFNAHEKSWAGRAVFAMVQTLAKKCNLNTMPILDVLIIDETHHVMAPTYRKIIARAKQLNPNVKIYGVTATPNRGDKQGLGDIFTNVADQITLGELVASHDLVIPKTYIINVGTQEQLKNVTCVADDFDMGQVEQIMNKTPINQKIIEHWQQLAQGRKTVVFCSTVRHAKDVAKAFNQANISAAVVHGKLSAFERKTVLKSFEQGDVSVIMNVAVLTEGWDYPPTACVILLRPSSYKSTMVQMIGRGLRTVDPQLFPGITKTDCIILDFGTSALMHGKLEVEIDLEMEAMANTGQKPCQACANMIPSHSRTCGLCGAKQETASKPPDVKPFLMDFNMHEIDLLQSIAALRWVDVFGTGMELIAVGLNNWGGAFLYRNSWHAIVGKTNQPPYTLHRGTQADCQKAVANWLCRNNDPLYFSRSTAWHDDPPSAAQLKCIPAPYCYNPNLTRYHATAMVAFTFNRASIDRLLRTSQGAKPSHNNQAIYQKCI